MNESTAAYMTLDADGSPSMLFFDRDEALAYCYHDELPIELVARASQSAPSPVEDVRAKALEEAAQEFDRRDTGDGWYDPHEPAQIIRALAQEGAGK